MKNFARYFFVQMKRVAKACPAIFLSALLLCGLLGLVGRTALKNELSKESSLKVQIGLVGDLDEYMGLNFNGILELLSGKFGIAFTEMTEEEAKKQLHDGKISTYVLIPEGMVDSIASGRNDKKIIYVGSEGQRGISSLVMEEVAASLSTLVTASQTAIYGMQDFLRDQGRKSEIRAAADEMNYAYLIMLSEIFQICELETTGLDNHVSAVGYYLCSFFILFILLSGINSAVLFAKKNMELTKLLVIRGQGLGRQILAEYLANLVLVLLCAVLAFSTAAIAIQTGMAEVPEWKDFDMETFVLFVGKMFPVILALSAMQFLIYEWADHLIGGILLQFLVTLAMGYLSGCFYPLSFFPEGLQRLGRALPAGSALKYANDCLSGRGDSSYFWLLPAYFVLFLWLAFLVRKRRMTAWEG